MQKLKVFMLGGDDRSWALDDDLRLTRQALETLVEFSDLESCDVIHSVWWDHLKRISPDALNGRRVVCHIPGEPFRYYALSDYSRVTQGVDVWVTQTRQARKELESLGIASHLIPYAVDTKEFYPLNLDQEQRAAFREKWHIPHDAYLIGSFQRDTQGVGYIAPKLVKGPDIFVEIMRALWGRGNKIHVVLAGPRRCWLRKKLTEFGIPFTFVGQVIDGEDDMSVNNLSHNELNVLYNQLDLYLVSSRSEGGPRAVLEAGSANCKILSTPVGLALDVLEPTCVYHSPVEAVGKIESDIHEDTLHPTVESHAQRVLQTHLPEKNIPLFQELYEQVARTSPKPRSVKAAPLPLSKKAQHIVPAFLRLFKRNDAPLKVSLWHDFVPPPFGGGNQFMLALRYALQSKGIQVVENLVQSDVDAHILNAIRFDVDLFRKRKSQIGRRVVHRIDGPISLSRSNGRPLDDLCFELNAEFAGATVLQSAWTYRSLAGMGYRPVNPAVVYNFVNPQIFHREGRVAFDKKRKIRLISTSWSANKRKGRATYKWLDQNLDWERYEFTFVGNISEPMENIRVLPAVPSEKLADILRQHDIYVFASEIESCSNALMEGLACGLPAIYYNDSSNPEVVGYGGVPFRAVEEIPAQLEKLVENYEMFQNLIAVPTLNQVVGKYIALIKDVAASR